MKEIKIVKSEEMVLVDDEDYERALLHDWRISSGKFSFTVSTYILVGEVRTYPSMASFIMKTSGILYDHIDRNPLNNQKYNLRVCTHAQNSYNTEKSIGNHTSQYKGVSWKTQSRRWCAQITYNKKKMHLGLFKDEREAARCYNKAAKELFKEFAFINNV